jgi:uncharacterized protein (TIGR03083 family)
MATTTALPLEALPKVPVEEWRRLAPEQFRSFLVELRELSPEEWDAPTDCDRWSVKDIVAHILGWAHATVSPREGAHQFRAGFAYRKELGNILNGQNEVQVEERRSMSTEELIAALEHWYPKFLKFRRRAGGNVSRVVPFAYPTIGFTNLTYLMNTIFMRDMLAHRVDIATAVDRPLRRTMVEDRILEDCLKEWASLSTANATLRVTGIGAGEYRAGEGSAATITTDGTQMVRVLAKRANPSELEIDGDRASAERWLAVGCPF